MVNPAILPCDGCGQLAAPDHIDRRVHRLEWATRCRPIHVQALLLSAFGPNSDEDFLYHPECPFTGLNGRLLAALGLPRAGKSHDEILAEFQKRGLVLASVLECPVESGADLAAARGLLERHLPRALARIRRSFKPRRVLVVSPELRLFLSELSESALGCPVFWVPLTVRDPLDQPNQPEIDAFQSALTALPAAST